MEGPSGSERREQGARHRPGGGQVGIVHARIIPEESKRRRMGKREDNQGGWVPSWLVRMVADPHPVYKPPSAGNVFSLTVRTAHCVYKPKDHHHLSKLRPSGRCLLANGSYVPGCSAVRAPLSSAWYVPHIRHIIPITARDYARSRVSPISMRDIAEQCVRG